MKKPLNYTPKYSLSIAYLKQIMTRQEFKALMAKYIAVKMENWGNYKGKKILKSKDL